MIPIFALCTFLLLCASSLAETDCFSESRGGCWNLGTEWNVASSELCLRACVLLPKCESFYYLKDLQTCHLCSDESLDWDANCVNGCVYGSKTCSTGKSNPTIVDILRSSLQTAADMCKGTTIQRQNNVFNDFTQEDIIQAAKDLQQIIQFRESYEHDGFLQAYKDAVHEAISILGDSNCKNQCADFLRLQLQTMILLDYPNPSKAIHNDSLRLGLLDEFRIFLADSGWLNQNSVDALYLLYDTIPNHLLKVGLFDNNEFVVQYMANTYNCDPSVKVSTEVYNVSFTIDPAVQYNQETVQSFPDDTPNMPQPGDLLMTSVKHEISNRFGKVVVKNQRLSSMLNYLYLKSKAGNHSKHWLGAMEAQFFERNPHELFAYQIGRQYMFSSSSQLNLAIERLGPLSFDTSTGVSEGGKCEKIDKEFPEMYSSRVTCRQDVRKDSECTGDYFMWNKNNGTCSCCSPDSEFSQAEGWTLYKYQYRESNVPTPFPLSWWLFNVDLFADGIHSTFYEYGEDGKVLPICVRLWRDEIERITTISVPGCGLLDFGYSAYDKFLVESVSENAIGCRPNVTMKICENDPNEAPVKLSASHGVRASHPLVWIIMSTCIFGLS